MITTAIFPARYVQGLGALGLLGEELARLGRRVEDLVDEVLSRRERLRKAHGKKVFQVQPKTDWDKGCAVRWLLERLDLDRPEVEPVYVGDDVTDEDAFHALGELGRGVAVVVRGEGAARSTAAQYALSGPEEVRRFLHMLMELTEGERT